MLDTDPHLKRDDQCEPGAGLRSRGRSKNRTLVDLFAGCGGLSLGFEQAGFTPIFVNEVNVDAQATYLANRHHLIDGKKFSSLKKLHSNDIAELTDSRLDEVRELLSSASELGVSFPKNGQSTIDVLAGGPPCQGFSGLGIRRSYAVDRKDIPSNKLYLGMIDVIENLRPRIFLFENVRGLVSARWTQEGAGEIWYDVRKAFRDIDGYTIKWQVVQSKDYGVPQNRPRVLLVGIRDDIIDATSLVDRDAPEDEAVNAGFLPRGEDRKYPNLRDLLGDLVDAKIDLALRSGEYEPGVLETTSYPKKKPRPGIQEYLRAKGPGGIGDDVLTEQVYSKHAPHVVAKFALMIENKQNANELPERFRTKKFSQRLLPAVWKKNRGPFITATSLPDDYVHFKQPRILTVREWARLQLFPDWYRFEGKRTTGGLRRAGNPREGIYERELPKYTQVGNAVPVGLAKRVGEHFAMILDDATS